MSEILDAVDELDGIVGGWLTYYAMPGYAE